MSNILRIHRLLPSLEALVCFVAVARSGSFTSAATELSITQSAVSKQIKALEDALNCVLFDRHTKGINLNATGKVFLDELEPILHNLQRSVEKTKYGLHGHSISITCTTAVANYWLFSRIVKFNQIHPEIKVNVCATNGINEQLCTETDLGVLYGNGDWRSLSATEVIPEVVYPACGEHFVCDEPQTPRDLLDLPLIQLDAHQWNCMDWQDWFSHFGIDYQIPHNALTFNQITLTFDAAIAGLGVSLVWHAMAKTTIESGKLRRLGSFEFHTGRADFLVHAKFRPLSPQAEIFKSWLIASAD